MSEHGVKLVEFFNSAKQLSQLIQLRETAVRSLNIIFTINSSRLGRNSCSGGSNRRIVTGRPSIARKMPSKSPRWMGSKLFQRRTAILLVVRKNHGAHVRKTVLGEEHVLGTAQSDALGAKRARLFRVAGNVRVGPHADLAEMAPPSRGTSSARDRPARRGSGTELALDRPPRSFRSSEIRIALLQDSGPFARLVARRVRLPPMSPAASDADTSAHRRG